MLKPVKANGFTIIELMIATMVFSVILLICAAALIQIGRIYHKGVITNQTQEVARTIMSNIAESIQFTGGDVRKIPGSTDFCVDNKQYSFTPPDRKLDKDTTGSGYTKLALVAGIPITLDCSEERDPSKLVDGTATGDELLSPNMRVLRLLVCKPGDTDAACNPAPPAGGDLYRVEVTIAYGDFVLSNGDSCVSSAVGGSFCAVSKLSTTVQRRIIN
jgi:prepilin-type N-terminal cleavage/methylation domain-containing protein